MKLLVVVFSLSLIILSSAKSSPEVNEAEPDNEYLPPLIAKARDSAQLTGDGYQEYLPPLAKSIQESLSPVEEDSDTVIADDGYRYKTVRKLKFRLRQRRDVSEVEMPSNDYLPPPANAKAEPELKTVLADDGYRYQIVKRLKYRRNRRETSNAVDSIPDQEYLPPVTETDVSSPDDTVEVKSADLTDDGYRYKTLRKVIYRARQ